MNGHPASRARRRAISVFPTPVGPIIRMFFGVTSSIRSAANRRRRQRLRRAMATARLASAWPTTKRSSSETISRGVNSVIVGSDRFHRQGGVGVDADIGGDRHGAPGDLLGGHFEVQQGAGGGQRVGSARADRRNTI